MDYCFYNCTNLVQIQFNNSQNISTIGNDCFLYTKNNINVIYYNAMNYNSLPSSLQNTQIQFNNPVYFYYPYIYPYIKPITNGINLSTFISKKSKKQTQKRIVSIINKL
jgi:hypothetical protein